VIETLMNVRPYNKLEPEIQTSFLQWMVLSDEPDHQRLRRLVAKAFTPKRIMSMEPRMTDVANRLLSELPRNDTFLDVARAYTNALPVSVISAMMGVEENQWPVMHRVSMEFTKFLDPRRGFDADVMNNSVNELSVLINELADQRRLDPRDDLVTALVELEGDEDRLTRSELVSMVGMLIFAGHETTDGLLGNALVAPARHPTQRRLLMDNPALWPSAIEELIRFDTSVQVDPRVTTSEIQLGDITIPAGMAVSVMIGAANRDPRRYDNPNELRLERFMAEFGEFEADTEAIEWKQTTTLRGPTVLPIKRAPAAAIR
jgi:cytochrome P450